MATQAYPASRVRIRQIDPRRRRFTRCFAHDSELERPEFVLGLAAALGLGLEIGLPLPMVLGGYAFALLGLVLVVCGLSIAYAAYQQLRSFGQNPAPGYATTRLITSGLFRYSRNPICVGYVMALLGLALLLESTGLLVAFLPFVLLARRTLIRPEEAYLEQVFGEDYRRYARAVRRWV